MHNYMNHENFPFGAFCGASTCLSVDYEYVNSFYLHQWHCGSSKQHGGHQNDDQSCGDDYVSSFIAESQMQG